MVNVLQGMVKILQSDIYPQRVLSRKSPNKTQGVSFGPVLYLLSGLVTAYTRVKKPVCRNHSTIEIFKWKVSILGIPLCFPFLSQLGNFGDYTFLLVLFSLDSVS